MRNSIRWNERYLRVLRLESKRLDIETTVNLDDGQKTDPQSLDSPNGLPKWTTTKNNILSEYYLKL